jgi:hypothetical protein
MLVLGALILSLSGCLYAKQDVLDNLAGDSFCPFQPNVAYDMRETSFNEHGVRVETSIGKARFVTDADKHLCVLRDAAGLTQSGSALVANIINSTNKHLEDGVDVSYVNGAAKDGLNQIEFTIVHPDGTVESRGQCNAANGAEKLVIPDIPLNSDGESCTYSTEAELRTAARNSRYIGVSRIFRPAPL